MYYSNLIINLTISISLLLLYYYITGKTFSVLLSSLIAVWFIAYIPIAINIETDNIQVILIILSVLTQLGAFGFAVKNGY